MSAVVFCLLFTFIYPMVLIKRYLPDSTSFVDLAKTLLVSFCGFSHDYLVSRTTPEVGKVSGI